MPRFARLPRQYLYWNEAQKQQYTNSKPNRRSFTINRAWQPGMQRFPAIAWTGDGQSCTHQELLRGILNGAALVACDLTSPDATTLVRQYQSAVFTPIMRVHMMQHTCGFPFPPSFPPLFPLFPLRTSPAGNVLFVWATGPVRLPSPILLAP